MFIYCLFNNVVYLFGKCVLLEKENVLKKVISESIVFLEIVDVENCIK